MQNKKVCASFSKLKKDFILLSSEVISMVQDKLKLVVNEIEGLNLGCYEWAIENKNRKATLHLYWNGQVLVYLQDKLTPEEKVSFNVSLDYLDLDPDTDNFKIFDLKDEKHFEKMVWHLKKHLI